MDYFAYLILFFSIINLLLGIIIFLAAKKDQSNVAFFVFALICSLWTFNNFLLRLNPSTNFIRLSYGFGIFVASFGLAWVYLFLKKKIPGFIKWFIVPLSFPIFAFTAFSDYVIKSLVSVQSFGYASVEGTFFSIYSIYFGLNVFLIIYNLVTEFIKRQDKSEKQQILYVLLGAGLFSTVSFFVSFIIPVVFKNFGFTAFDNLSLSLFLIFIVYAITKHHLFDIKVIATEFLTFALWVILLVKTFLSSSFQDWIINGSIFISVLIFGFLLIRGILKEVKQREKMEKLALDLEKAFESEKKAKERIEEAQVEDEALLSSIGDGVVAIDKEGKIMFINRAAEHMLSIQSENVINRPYSQVLVIENEKGEVLEEKANPLYQVLNTGIKIVTEASSSAEKTVYYTRKDGTKFPAATTVAPVILNGKIIGAVDVFRDITVERQIDKSKTEFVSLASHQLRTPLTAIKWYSEMMMGKKGENLTPKQKNYLETIYHGNERMIKLIDVMLNISRLDAGKIKPHDEPVDIKKIVEIIIGEEQVNIKKRKQKFSFQCKEKEAKTISDPNHLRIVFQNVISNAVKYTPNGGKIVCALEKEEGDFLFSITDSGIGIPKEQQGRIFEKLFRAENAAPHDPEGNGLGLYAAKATIENLGGKIWFDSKEGKGTTFFVKIPIKVV